MHKKISILIPCYMLAEFLEETVISAINQTIPAQEIIVLTMDDKSDDKMTYLLQSKAKGSNIHWLTTARRSLPVATNYLINASIGTHFIPLISGDKLESDYIEEISKIDAPIVYTNYRKFGIVEGQSYLNKKSNIDLLKYNNEIPYCSLVLKDAWKQVGGYNESMIYGGDDWEFWLNLHKHGYNAIWTGNTYFWNRVTTTEFNRASTKNNIFDMITKIHPDLYK